MILDAIPGLGRLLDYLSRERHRHEDARELAIGAIFAAVSETRIYFAKLERAKRRNRKAEEELARLWSKAAVASRRLDRDMTERCLLKSQYWVSPDKWQADDVTTKRIPIDTVYDKARQLLLQSTTTIA